MNLVERSMIVVERGLLQGGPNFDFSMLMLVYSFRVDQEGLTGREPGTL